MINKVSLRNGSVFDVTLHFLNSWLRTAWWIQFLAVRWAHLLLLRPRSGGGGGSGGLPAGKEGERGRIGGCARGGGGCGGCEDDYPEAAGRRWPRHGQFRGLFH